MPSSPAPSNWENQRSATETSSVCAVIEIGPPGLINDESTDRRSENGRDVRSSSPSASTSKSTSSAGVSTDRSRTRDSAGCTRCSRAAKSRPLCDDDGTMISPSTTHRSGRYDSTAATISGKYRCIGLVFRDPISTESPSRNTMARKPSHFGSYSLPAGMEGTDLASMGSTGGITGSVIREVLPAPATTAADSPAGEPAREAGSAGRAGRRGGDGLRGYRREAVQRRGEHGRPEDVLARVVPAHVPAGLRDGAALRGELGEHARPPVGQPEHDRVGQVPAEDVLALLEAQLVRLGRREVPAEAQRLREHRGAVLGAGRGGVAERDDEDAHDREGDRHQCDARHGDAGREGEQRQAH